MAPFGHVYGNDRAGNFKVRPEGGGRPVILNGSRRYSLETGKRVEYLISEAGRVVDFADVYTLGNPNSRLGQDSIEARTTASPKYADERTIRDVTKRIDLTGKRILVAYDQDRTKLPTISGERYDFFVAARNFFEIHRLTRFLDNRGVSTYFWAGVEANGIQSEAYWTRSNIVHLITRPGLEAELFAVPIRGLVGEDPSTTTKKNFQAFAESVLFPLEDRVRL